MKIQEFSDSFDTLLNSYAHSAQFGSDSSTLDIEVDEFEKSVFLTSAQEDIVKELYSGKYTGDSFESSEKLRRELDFLVTTKEYTQSDISSSTDNLPDTKFQHTTYTLQNDCLYIVYEQVQWSTEDQCLSSLIADVYPVTHDEYWRVRRNPFRGPDSKRVLRIDKGKRQVELVSAYTIGKYVIRYVRYPNPIILVDLTDSEQEINGIKAPTGCELTESLHREILDRAVKMALTSKMINNRSNGKD